MKFISILIIAVAFLVFTSCKQEDKKADENTQTESTSSNAPTISAPSTGNTTMPAADPSSQTQPTPSQPQPGQSSGNVALNPEHGQPGHRCDIPVGEPLSTPPSQQQQPQTIQVQ